MIQILKMAFRDLGRNRRRSFFSALAVGGGLALLILMSSVVAGEMGSALESAIKLQTGHIQIRAATYDENKSSLKWEDLVANPDEIASAIGKLSQVKAATPRLYASGFLSSGTQSARKSRALTHCHPRAIHTAKESSAGVISVLMTMMRY